MFEWCDHYTVAHHVHFQILLLWSIIFFLFVFSHLLYVWVLSLTLISGIHSGLLTVEWLAALCPRKPLHVCICHLVALAFSYVVIANLARVPAWILHKSYIVLNPFIILAP